MNALNTPIASMLITIMPTPEPTNTLMMAPNMITSAPAKSHLPSPEISRLMMLDRLAITKNTPAVPPNAVMIRLGPFLNPSTIAIRRDSISPMKKVKASSTGTPAAEFLVRSMANMNPKATPRKTTRPSPPFRPRVMPVATPSQAPSTVGTRLSARSQ